MPVYNIGSPIFKNVKIHLKNSKVFEIEARNASAENKYILSATLNGKPWSKPWFSHEELINGGKLIFEMGSKANHSWGSSLYDAPPSGTDSK
jgi:putative alpha-1,2-mannosidase